MGSVTAAAAARALDVRCVMFTGLRHYAFVSFLTLSACPAPTPTADECLPSYGNQCDGCVPKCLTQREIDDLGDICDIDCVVTDTDEEPIAAETWTCEVTDGACAVVE